MARLRYDFNMLNDLCVEAGVTLLVDYKEQSMTRDTRIIGKCISCENSFDKSLNKLYKQKNFGCDVCSKVIKFQRIKTTMIQNYGVEYAAQNKIFMDKQKETTLIKYGVEHACQNEQVKEKILNSVILIKRRSARSYFQIQRNQIKTALDACTTITSL